MNLLYSKEHVSCFNYDHSTKPIIEELNIKVEEKESISINTNEIVFFLEGKLRFIFKDFPEYIATKGEIVFLAAGGDFSYEALSDCVIVVFRIHKPMKLCNTFPVERLNNIKNIDPRNQYKPHTEHLSLLQMNPRVWYLIYGVRDSLSDGQRCVQFFELKIQEFFLTLRIYYTKEEIHDFLYLVLSGDTAFSEYIRLNWNKHRTVQELAKSMNMATKAFTLKFKDIFKTSPYKWMLLGRAQHIQNEILTSNKPFKQIAMENDFVAFSQFSRFCKKHLGQNPSEIRCKKYIT